MEKEEKGKVKVTFKVALHPCEFREECRYDDDGMEHRPVKVRDLPETIMLAVSKDQGILRLDPKQKIADSNILGKLLAIPEKGKAAMMQFFNENGFLLPASDSFKEINLDAASSLIDRIKDTAKLIDLISGPDEDDGNEARRWGQMLSIILKMHSKETAITYDGKTVYHTHRYGLWQVDDDWTEFFNKHKCYLGNNPDITGNASMPDSDFIGYSNEDGCRYNEYTGEIYLPDPLEWGKCPPRSIDNIYRVYHSVEDKNSPEALLYQLMLREYANDCYDPQNGRIESDRIMAEEFQDAAKEAISLVARHIVATEINYNICHVPYSEKMDPDNPENYSIYVYDEKAMRLTVCPGSLLQTIYYTLSLYNPRSGKYVKCADEKCGNYFLRSATNLKKRYCNRNCGSRKRMEAVRGKGKPAKTNAASEDTDL